MQIPSEFISSYFKGFRLICKPLAYIRHTLIREKLTLVRWLLEAEDTHERDILAQWNLLKAKNHEYQMFSNSVTISTDVENNFLSMFWGWQMFPVESTSINDLLWYSGHSCNSIKIIYIFPYTTPKLLSCLFSATENLYKRMISIFLFQYKFIFHLETHYFFYETENNWFGVCEAKLITPQACSHVTVLAVVFIWSNTDAIAVMLNLDIFFSSDICLQMCPLLASPTVFEVIIVLNSKGSSFLLLSSPIYQAHWNDKCKTESSCCPWADKNWSGHLKFKLRFVAGYYSFIWWFCF